MTQPIDKELAASGLELVRGADGLVLCADGLELHVDFAKLLPRVAPGRLSHELLVRACRVRNAHGTPLLVDATAGLGEDSFLLAAAGFEVLACEGNVVIAAMLQDAVERARQDERTAKAASRMHVHQGDSIEFLAAPGRQADVVYLDPMFPERTKSAAVKKKFQLLHRLERPCEDEDALLDAALGAASRKVVIKRPLKGAYLAGVKPSHSLAGKAIRFDCIISPGKS